MSLDQLRAYANPITKRDVLLIAIGYGVFAIFGIVWLSILERMGSSLGTELSSTSAASFTMGFPLVMVLCLTILARG
jgi:hypothetical protein